MNTDREKLKLELDYIDDFTINVVYRIVMALKHPIPVVNNEISWFANNPLKNSIIYEKDIISPIDETWDVETSNLVMSPKVSSK
jgi:hypothetical protein